MSVYARPIARLVEELAKLPGIGPKTAQRLAFHIISGTRENAENLAEAIVSN
jgi:recombination protein RecR